MYHGTHNEELDLDNITDLCLTDDEDVAVEYGPNVFEIDLSDNAEIAYEDDVKRIAEEQGISNPGWCFELVDERAVRDAVVAAGYNVIRYEDATEDNNTEHTTWRVLSSAAIAR